MKLYSPPVRDSLFVLDEVLDVTGCGLPAFSEVDRDLIEAIATEAGRFAANVLAPLNATGDQQGCMRHPDGSVTTPAGYPEAYRQYVEAGWGALALPADYGGQGMPHVLATVVEEYCNSACHAFTMYPGLTHGAVAMLAESGDDQLKQRYLTGLVTGELLGTMALTEPHCGTDLGLIRTKAERDEEGTYRITGEKIFCSGGEQDLTDNLVHLVLARLTDAPAGSRGISLFLVPKWLPDGSRNAAVCIAIEHKMGVNGSATCAMSFERATGYLLGAENAGLGAMFIMMNAARLSCGNQGLAQAERAYQNACAYALDRQQGKAPGQRSGSGPADAIIVHPDVRRMLMDARSFIEGFRALVAWTALQIDVADHSPDPATASAAQAMVELLTPVLKAFGTDSGFEITVAMQQVLGGHGYIREWGMEQYVRDARVAMIYEGANGVQAMDLVNRKLLRDEGRAAEAFFAMVHADAARAPDDVGGPLLLAVSDARAAAEALRTAAAGDAAAAGAGAYAFLRIMGIVATGWMWARIGAVAASKAGAANDDGYYAWKLATARYFAQRTLPATRSLRAQVEAGSTDVMALPAEAFAA